MKEVHLVVEFVRAMSSSSRAVRTAFRLTAIVLGFLQTWAFRFYIEPDGVNYFDIARAYLRRDWTNALNAYWSPLYSWLLALIQWTFHPSPYLESTFLHLLNFVLFLLVLASFEFFFHRFLSLIKGLCPQAIDSESLPGWAWWMLGYTAFLVCTLRLITLGSDSPDIALAAVLFLATGLLIDLAQSDRGTLHYAFLGLILGVGYLAKSAMLPLSFVYIVAAALARRGFKKPDLRALATFAGFLLVSTPFAVALSRAKGRLTFGDTGKVAYFNQVTPIPLGETTSSKFTHRPLRLFDEPPVYTYVTPFTSTYPAWYDPSYWLEGVKPHFVLRDQLRALARAFSNYFRILSTEKQWIAGWLALVFLAGDWRKTLKLFSKVWFMWLPSAAALALYAFVLVEPRYVAVGLAIACLALFAVVPWSRINTTRVGVAVVLAISGTTGLALLKEGLTNLAVCLQPARNVQWEVAQGLLKMGLAPGNQVAFLGHTTVADYWAHLAGLGVTADIPLEAMQSYWLASPEKRNQIASRLHEHGIKALVTAGTPLVPANWRSIGNTGYYVQALDPSLPGGSRSHDGSTLSDPSGDAGATLPVSSEFPWRSPRGHRLLARGTPLGGLP